MWRSANLRIFVVFGAVFASLWSAACAKPAAEVPVTKLELPAPPAAPAIIATSEAPRKAIDRECRASVRLREMKKSTPTCELNEQVSSDTGLLTWPCAGNGAASIQFGKVRFEGVVHEGLLEVTLTTSFPFADGCQWKSEQTIIGSVSSGTLQYRYDEVPSKTSQRCWAACQGTASIDVALDAAHDVLQTAR